jgi:hypothetical protein
MGIPVLILGESGTGKSASMRNFEPHSLLIANVSKKPLPFRGKDPYVFCNDSYTEIQKCIARAVNNGIKAIVIDDAQYLMANEFMRSVKEKGYEKFTSIAVNFWNLTQFCVSLPQDVVVYLLSHIERDNTGFEKCKTIGKMLDDKITVEGLFTIVLKTSVHDGVYRFSTQNSGNDTVKSPMEMFAQLEIDNDLCMVDSVIREYYSISPLAVIGNQQNNKITGGKA